MGGSDWKTPDQCKPPVLELKAEGGCPCYYDGSMHDCNKSPFPSDDRCVCGTSGSDWKTLDQCKPPVLELKAEGGCPCYYDGSMHDCNKSPFPNDNRCVCGTSGSDWKTPDQCRAPTPPPPQPSGVCPCYYDGSMHDCNKSPFPSMTDASAAHREATGRPLISAGRLRL